MTLYDIKVAVATYFKTTVADLTQNGQDLFLVAANHVRRQAELSHDFEFSRKLVTLTVDGEVGGSLENAVVYGTTTDVNIKTVIEAGLFDGDGNLRPVEWTTVAEGLERQRLDNPHSAPRYPTDGWYESGPIGFGRFELAGSSVYRFPKDADHDFTLGLEVYSMADDWTSVDNVVVTGAVTAYNGTYYKTNFQWQSKDVFYKANTSTLITYFIYYSVDTGGWVIQNGIDENGTAGYVSVITATSPEGAYIAAGEAGTPTVADSTVSDVWTSQGAEYLMWGIIVHLNYYYKEFVTRQEGNLGSPERLRDEALASFIAWDAYRFEQNRRHGR